MKLTPSNIILLLGISFLLKGSINLFAQTLEKEEMTINPEEKYQTVVGFGASLAYYESWLNSHPKKSEIYQAIFGELSLDILRVRNAHVYDPGMIARVQEYMNAAEFELGHPIPLLSTSWGPPGYLKNTGDRKNGGTLKYTIGPGGVEFDYAGFAHWWGNSLDAYANAGIYPTYISIQNEPSWSASWETCIMKPYETINSSDTIAGYNKALDAVYDTIQQKAKKPLILGPETSGIGSNRVENYVNALDISKLDGMAHHLYNGVNENNPYASIDFSGVGDFHPEIPHFQTEFSGGDWLSLAGLIYKSFYDEKVVVYLYWGLIWQGGAGLVSLDNPWNQSQWADPLKGYIRTKDFFVFKQFSTFIHPGWQMIGHTLTGSSSASLSFKSPTSDSAVCVIINRSSSDDLQVHLDIPGYRIYESSIYSTSASKNCELNGFLADSLLTLSPRSISTVDMRITPYDPADDIEAPSIPSNLTVVEANGFSISVTWDASTDNIGVSGYDVYLDGNWIGTTGNTSFIISGLNANTSYDISIGSFDNVPNISGWSDPVTGTTTGPDTQAPSAPSNLVLVDAAQTSLSVTWDASTDNVGVEGYHVFANGLLKGTTFTNSFTLSQLDHSTDYQVEVSAYDGTGNESAKSAPFIATTLLMPDYLPPSIPVNVKITGTTQTSILVSWFASSDNEGVTGYRIYVNGLLDGITTSINYSITHLIPGTNYQISVSAFDASANESAKSAAVTGKTKNGPDTEPPTLQATDTIHSGGTVEVISSEDGMLYLVPVETSKQLAVIRTASIDSLVAVQASGVDLVITGLSNGVYWIYATDLAGNISDPVAINVVGVGMEDLKINHFKVYPNPFSEAITFQFHLDEDQQLWLSVFDSQGKVVSKKFLGPFFAGGHSVGFQRRELTEGLYFFKLENSAGAYRTGRMIIQD